MNQLAYGEKIKVPGAVVRSVSFQKIRSGSLSSRGKPEKIEDYNRKCEQNKYQNLISKKLEIMQKDVIKPKADNNIEDLRKQLQERQMKQCTFKPKINEKVYKPRPIGEFVNQQMNYQKTKTDKVQEMRSMLIAKMDKQNTFQPNIHTQGHNDKAYSHNVHNRLYDDWRKKTQEDTINVSIEGSQTSKNKSKQKLSTYSRQSAVLSVNSSHTKKHTNNDKNMLMTQNSKNFTDRSGVSRNNSCKSLKNHKGIKITKHMDVRQVCEMKLKSQKTVDEQKQAKRVQKNKELYIQKILREISHILANCKISSKNLGYLELTLVLEKMQIQSIFRNFINGEEKVENRKYLYEIWEMLQGDVYETVPLINLIKLIFCLLGCHEKMLIDNLLKLYLNEQQARDRVLILSDKDSKRIKSNFQSLSLNRLKKGEYINNCLKSDPYPFKPYISKNSNQMAQKYRQRVIQQSQELINNQLISYPINEDGIVDHVDILMLDQKRKELKLKIKREEYEKEKIRQENQIMRVNRQYVLESRPKRKTIAYLSEELNDRGEVIGNRTDALYEMGKQLLRQKHNTTPENQLPKQCTFHPTISKPRQNSFRNISRDSPSQQSEVFEQHKQITVQKSSQQIKDFDKSIFRMYEARKMRQDSKEKMGACWKQNDEFLMKKDDSPLVYLNVNMEGYQEVKLPVFKSDNIRTITHKVRALMNIVEDDEQKLEQILKIQILPALDDIGCRFDSSSI